MKDFLKRIIKLSPFPLSKNHLYDIQTKRIIKRNLNEGSNCIDVGCFQGEILDLMIKAAPMGQHWAFEPIPELYNALKKKYLHTSQCHILNYALSNSIGVSTFNYVVSNPSYSGLKKRDYDRKHETEKEILVNTVLLDDLIPDDMPVHLIKIDVEGAELLVLEGAGRIISNYKPLVIFEHGLGASDHYGSTPEKIFGFFHSHSMSISTLSDFIKKADALSLTQFKEQYFNKQNYYFIAHPQ